MARALALRMKRGVRLPSLLGAFRWSGVLALNYHRIGDGSASVFDRGLWSTTADALAEQIRFCKAHCEVIAPGDLPYVLARRHGRYILMTFDDGYRDNYEAAFPILRSEGVPATFFVATGFIDSPRAPWWDEIAWMVRASPRRAVALPGWLPAPVWFDGPDRERAVRTLLRTYKSIPTESTEAFLDDIADATGSGRCEARQGEDWWMTWDMLREMQSAGMAIGGHTVNHPVLARAPLETQRREIDACGHRLSAELGEPMRYFSYPVGGARAFDGATREYLRASGVQYAFSYYGGFRRFGDWDDHDVRRVPMESDVSFERFRALVEWPGVFA